MATADEIFRRLVVKRPVSIPPPNRPVAQAPAPKPVARPPAQIKTPDAIAISAAVGKRKPPPKSRDYGAGYGGDVVGRIVGTGRLGTHPDVNIQHLPPGFKDWCFEWGGKKWGRDYPGWSAFKKWLIAHDANIDDWISKHTKEAKCIGATKGKPTVPDDPNELVVIPPEWCQNGTRRLIKRRWLDETVSICRNHSALVSSAYRTQSENNETPGAAKDSDHLRGDAIDLVAKNLTALYIWAEKQGFPYVEPMSESVNHVHISFAHGGSKPKPPTTDFHPLSGMAFVDQVRASADLYDVDPLGAMANSFDEGIAGGIGDSGNAYGPWQAWFADGRVSRWSGTSPGSNDLNAWAWSAEGIQEAFSEMAADKANHVHGRASVKLILDNFEKPTERTKNLADRLAYYDHFVELGDGVWRFIANNAKGPLGPVAPPTALPDVNPTDVPKPRAAWVDTKQFLTQGWPAAGTHATAVGGRLTGIFASRPWTAP